jgi:hypothetical protein
MAEQGQAAACAICHTRRPRRHCPGISGQICPVCCGIERENSVSCPLDCSFLREARLREPDPEVDPSAFPNQDIRVDEAFLQRNEPLLLFFASGLATAALEQEDFAIDNDVRDALAALVSTYRALHSGLYYNVEPDNPIAGRILKAVMHRVSELEEMLRKNESVLRDSDLLGVFAFLQRLEIQKNNGRRKGRAFIDFLREFFPPEPPATVEAAASPSGLILP